MNLKNILIITRTLPHSAFRIESRRCVFKKLDNDSHVTGLVTDILNHMPEPSVSQRKELDSGLTVIFEPMPWLKTASASLLLPVGSVTDPEGLDGSSAVLAEWMQRGTRKMNSRAFSDSLDALGARHGGSAGREYTTFGISCLASVLPEALKLIAESIRDPRFDQGEFPGAQAVVVQERASLADHPDQRLFEKLGTTFFSSSHGRSPYGTEEGLKALTPTIIKNDYWRRVSPKGAILGIAGWLSWETVIKAAESNFGNWKQKGSANPPSVSVAPRTYVHSQEDINQVQIGLAFETTAPNSPFWYHHVIGLQVLSGSTGSRLHTEVREKRGLVYSVGASTRALKDFSYVVGYAGTKPDRASETLRVVQDELSKMRKGINKEELERAKTGLLSSLVLQGESSGARATALTQDAYLRGRSRSLDEIHKKITVLSLDEVNQYLFALPAPSPTVVTLGPVRLQGKIETDRTLP